MVSEPSGSITPYFTSLTEATLCLRSATTRSSVVSRSWRSLDRSSCPLRMMMAGCPLIRRRKKRLLSERMLSSTSSATSAAIGTRPKNSGMPRSCMGTAARSLTRMVTTSSAGSISPSWRFPISRTAQMTAKYSTSVRTRGTDMKPPPFQKICGYSVRRNCANYERGKLINLSEIIVDKLTVALYNKNYILNN